MSPGCLKCDGEVEFIGETRTFHNICDECWWTHIFLYGERSRAFRKFRTEHYCAQKIMRDEFPRTRHLFLQCKNCEKFKLGRWVRGTFCSPKCKQLDEIGIKATERFAHVKALQEAPYV